MKRDEKKPVTEKDKRIIENIENFIWNPVKYKEEKK
jgi:hypothetical protein